MNAICLRFPLQQDASERELSAIHADACCCSRRFFGAVRRRLRATRAGRWSAAPAAARRPTTLDGYEPHQTSKLYAADGRFIAELGLERRTLVKLTDIPPLVRNAFVVTEDKRFYQHAGIDWVRVPGALLVDIKKRNVQRRLLDDHDAARAQHLSRAASRATRRSSASSKRRRSRATIEAHYSKDRILELYLNQIYLGNGAYGVETAAQRYFGKSVQDLNVAEAAMLAALPKGPGALQSAPLPRARVQRRNIVIALMRDAKRHRRRRRRARRRPIRCSSRRSVEARRGRRRTSSSGCASSSTTSSASSSTSRASRSTRRSTSTCRRRPSARWSASSARSRRAIRRVSRTSPTSGTWRAPSDDDDRTHRPNSPYLQGAFIAMDPRTGAVRALVGGRDFDDSKFDRAMQAVRQPGSTFKPIVYADAIQNGRPLSYMLDDSPLTVPTARQRDLDAAELRGRLRRQDPDASRALSVAQRADDPARHGARRRRA